MKSYLRTFQGLAFSNAREPLDNVAIPIPAVNHGRGDARNILGVIVYRDTEKDLYRIAVKAGLLKG